MVHFIWLVNVCFCCVRFSFVPYQSRLARETSLIWPILCRVGLKTTTQSIRCNTHTHARLTAFCPGQPGWASAKKVKPIWILLKQRTVSGSGISWAICFCISLQTDNHASTPPHTHPFNGPFSRTTQVGRYQKGKTNLDFTEARDSEWQCHQLGHMQVCTSLQADNHASTPPLSYLQAWCPSCRPTNSVRAL